MYPRDEDSSALLNNEISESMENARTLLNDGDKVGSRLAFRDAYNKRIQQARQVGELPQWFVSMGRDKVSRNDVILEAVKKGRISAERASMMLPTEYHERVLSFVRSEMAAIK